MEEQDVGLVEEVRFGDKGTYLGYDLKLVVGLGAGLSMMHRNDANPVSCRSSTPPALLRPF